jgi:hypothetical protein
VLLCVSFTGATNASAQRLRSSQADPSKIPVAPSSDDRVLSDTPGFYLMANMVFGGVAALVQSIGRPSVSKRQAVLWGAIGGATMYGGQRLIGTGEPALRFSGLQTVAFGANLARNAGTGEGLTSDLIFPVYPFYVRVRNGDVGLKLSASATKGMLDVLTRPGLNASMDWEASLLAGTTIFRVDGSYLYPAAARSVSNTCWRYQCEGAALGNARAGIVVYVSRPNQGQHRTEDIMAHELVHVSQFTRDALLYSVPVHDAIVKRTGKLGRWVDGWVIVDLARPIALLNQAAAGKGGDPGIDNWHEREAEAMRGARLCDRPDVTCTW